MHQARKTLTNPRGHFTRRRDSRGSFWINSKGNLLLFILLSFTSIRSIPFISVCIEFIAIELSSAKFPNPLQLTMAKGDASSPTGTPPSVLKRTTSSAQNMKSQKSILGFFQKSSPATPSGTKPREPASSPAQRASEQRNASATKPKEKRSFSSFAQDLTPVPSSDLPIPEDDEENADTAKVCWFAICRLPSFPPRP